MIVDVELTDPYNCEILRAFARNLEMMEACQHPGKTESVGATGKPESRPPRGRALQRWECARLERAAAAPAAIVDKWESPRTRSNGKETPNPYTASAQEPKARRADGTIALSRTHLARKIADALDA